LINVLIASPLEPELVERLVTIDPRLRVTYRADLVGNPRFPADHHPPVSRTPAQEAEWAELLASAEVLFDVDGPSMRDFPKRVPNLRWIQSSSSGIGEWVRRLGIVDAPIQVTNAAGLHARPLAEFVVFAMLYFARRWPRMAAEQRAHHWQRCAIDTLEDKTLGIIGLGRVGRAVASLARPFGVRVLGLKRTPGGASPTDYGVDAVYGPAGLTDVLESSDYLVLSLPHTEETVGLIGAAELSMLSRGAVFINIARGTLIDEPALIAALQSSQLGGAALDVVASEPLATDSPLWSMDNVIITPHSMSTAFTENARIIELFAANLSRYANAEPLHNVIDKVRGY
jgi:phosphoglycerate dehydrogenase-like enzyme